MRESGRTEELYVTFPHMQWPVRAGGLLSTSVRLEREDFDIVMLNPQNKVEPGSKKC